MGQRALELVGLERNLPSSKPEPPNLPVSVSAPEAVPYFSDLPQLALLDSSICGGHNGRYSYLVADPFVVIRSRGRKVELSGPAGDVALELDPFEI